MVTGYSVPEKGRPWIFGGNKEGITDMYTLARTQKIYGSFQSSFSDMAAQIGGVPLEILKL